MGGRSKRNLALYLQEEDLMRRRYENTGTLGGTSSTEATGGARLRQAPAAVLIRLESLQTHRLVLTGPDEMKLTLESLRTGGHQKRYLDRRRPRRRQRLNIVNVVVVGQRSRTTVCAATRSRGLADRQTAWCPDGWYLRYHGAVSVSTSTSYHAEELYPTRRWLRSLRESQLCLTGHM